MSSQIRNERRKIVLNKIISAFFIAITVNILWNVLKKLDLLENIYSKLYYPPQIILFLLLFLILFFTLYNINYKVSPKKLISFNDIMTLPILVSIFLIPLIFENIIITLISYAIVCIIIVLEYFQFKSSRNIQKQNNDPLKDMPISNENEDFLDRRRFIDSFIHIIQNCQGKGNRLLLSGSWGSGKTSILNCVKENLDKNPHIWYREVNPWNNDTKEKFAKALLYEIDNFSRNTFPYTTISKNFSDNLLGTIDSFGVGPFHFHIPKKSDNMYNNITELQKDLNFKKEKLIILIDDFDRLSKQQILDILSIIYVFNDCNNIIFILSANIDKVEDILTETETYMDNETNSIKNVIRKNSYSNYIEKMTSNIIKLPEIKQEKINRFFIQQIDLILQQVELPPLTEMAKNSIPLSGIKTLRTAKRILQSFKNSLLQSKFKNEVNPFHFLLVTILFTCFHKTYQELNKHRNMCIENYLKENSSQQKELYEFFDNILSFYPDQKEFIKSILIILNPNYRQSLYHNKTDNEPDATILDIFEKFPILQRDEYLEKAFYKEYYIDRYFVEDIPNNTIPDKILDDIFDRLKKDSLAKNINVLTSFMVKNIEKIESFFNYIFTTHKISTSLFDQVFISCAYVISKNCSVVSLQYKKILLDKMIAMIRNNKIHDEMLIKIFTIVHSFYIKSKIYFIYSNIGRSGEQIKEIQNTLYQNLIKEYPASANIKNMIEDCLEYNSYESWYIWLWAREFHTKGQLSNDRKQTLKNIMKSNEKYFWYLIGEDIYKHIRNTQDFPFKFDTPFTSYEISEITDTLLKRKNLKYKKEILEINNYYKQKINPTI